MSPARLFLELQCPRCPWSEVCAPADVARWLLKARKVRPGREPAPEIMAEVLRASAAALACPSCGRTGLRAGPACEDRCEWPEAVCSACAGPIPAERLEALPGATFCAACQRMAESGRAEETEYCPKCGSPMALRLSRGGGPARYVMVCTGSPPCRLS